MPNLLLRSAEARTPGLADPAALGGSPRGRLPLRRLLLAVPASALVLVGAAVQPAPAASATRCADAGRSVASIGTTRGATAVRCLVNVERRAAGLRPLRTSTRLARSARDHARDMDRRGYFAHAAPSGSTPGTRLRSRGYRWSAVGENIAAGQRTPREVMRAWVRSPGHCANLMSRQFTVIGVGISRGGPGKISGPTWAQVLARPSGTRPLGGRAVSCPRRPVV